MGEGRGMPAARGVSSIGRSVVYLSADLVKGEGHLQKGESQPEEGVKFTFQLVG